MICKFEGGAGTRRNGNVTAGGNGNSNVFATIKVDAEDELPDLEMEEKPDNEHDNESDIDYHNGHGGTKHHSIPKSSPSMTSPVFSSSANKSTAPLISFSMMNPNMTTNFNSKTTHLAPLLMGSSNSPGDGVMATLLEAPIIIVPNAVKLDQGSDSESSNSNKDTDGNSPSLSHVLVPLSLLHFPAVAISSSQGPKRQRTQFKMSSPPCGEVFCMQC